jgi:hypothetical protein
MVLLQVLAAGVILKVATKARRRNSQRDIITAGVIPEQTPVAEEDPHKNSVSQLEGEMKISSIVVRDENTSQVLLWSTCGELHGNDGFLALTAKDAELRGKINKNMQCCVDMVNAEGIIIDRLNMLFEKRSFGNYIFTSEV